MRVEKVRVALDQGTGEYVSNISQINNTASEDNFAHYLHRLFLTSDIAVS